MLPSMEGLAIYSDWYKMVSPTNDGERGHGTKYWANLYGQKLVFRIVTYDLALFFEYVNMRRGKFKRRSRRRWIS
jgi:hypothetical protein